MLRGKTILVCSPHTDDGEFGCGATLARFLREGKRVYYAVFSTCQQSVPKGFPLDVLEKEQSASAKALGIGPRNVKIFDFPVRHFPAHRQAILETLVALRKKIKPDIVFMPSARDIHQDHATIAHETRRAFKNTVLLGYELPWNTRHFKGNLFVTVEKKDLDKKIRALACYRSQQFRHYADKELVVALARVRGAHAAVQYAEGFELINGVLTR